MVKSIERYFFFFFTLTSKLCCKLLNLYSKNKVTAVKIQHQFQQNILRISVPLVELFYVPYTPSISSQPSLSTHVQQVLAHYVPSSTQSFLFSWFSPPHLITPSSKENLRSLSMILPPNRPHDGYTAPTWDVQPRKPPEGPNSQINTKRAECTAAVKNLYKKLLIHLWLTLMVKSPTPTAERIS